MCSARTVHYGLSYGALMSTDNVDKAREILEDESVISVVQFAPSVRATLGDAFGTLSGTNVEKRIIAGLKMMGANYVLDTNFSADVVIMEEGTELLNRIKDKHSVMPMFTSCCPGWVSFVEQHRPEMLDHLSTTRSPQAVLSSLPRHGRWKNRRRAFKDPCDFHHAVHSKEDRGRTPTVGQRRRAGHGSGFNRPRIGKTL